MIDEERGLHRLGELRAGIVVGAHAALLEHDFALGQDDRIGEHEAGHAIGLEGHDFFQMIARHPLKIGGVIGRGERVLLPAERGERPGKTPGRILGRALEHQMFEEMRETRFSQLLVGRAHAVPDHVRDDRRAVIGDHHDFEAVRERELANGRARGLGPGAARIRQGCGPGNGECGQYSHQHPGPEAAPWPQWASPRQLARELRSVKGVSADLRPHG